MMSEFRHYVRAITLAVECDSLILHLILLTWKPLAPLDHSIALDLSFSEPFWSSKISKIQESYPTLSVCKSAFLPPAQIVFERISVRQSKWMAQKKPVIGATGSASALHFGDWNGRIKCLFTSKSKRLHIITAIFGNDHMHYLYDIDASALQVEHSQEWYKCSNESKPKLLNPLGAMAKGAKCARENRWRPPSLLARQSLRTTRISSCTWKRMYPNLVFM
jgi:hypothetical protein